MCCCFTTGDLEKGNTPKQHLACMAYCTEQQPVIGYPKEFLLLAILGKEFLLLAILLGKECLLLAILLGKEFLLLAMTRCMQQQFVVGHGKGCVVELSHCLYPESFSNHLSLVLPLESAATDLTGYTNKHSAIICYCPVPNKCVAGQGVVEDKHKELALHGAKKQSC